ncbi:MAG TPA: ABC transporter permease [Devosiaceae bacterium]|jgi:peptide/nickel transport system permease protein
MQRYILMRLFHALLALIAVSIIIFILVRLSGDPMVTMLPPEATDADRAILRAHWGLDQPLYQQYFSYIGNILHGDFGTSLKWHQPVLTLMLQRLPATLDLAWLALIVASLVGLPIGVISAVKKGTLLDEGAKVFALLGQSMPSFWLATMMIWLFAVNLGWLPTSGRGNFSNMIMPAIALGLFQVAAVARVTRSSMIDVMDSEYVKLARIKGLSETKVIWKHGLRNASVAPLTYFGMIIGGWISGSVVIETVFAWPGIGLLSIEAIRARDIPVVQTIVIFFSLLFCVCSLLVDVLYAYLDPRIRYDV